MILLLLHLLKPVNKEEEVTYSSVSADIVMLFSVQDCVRSKALMSVLMVRNVTPEKALEVVDKVFDKCYQDLEPVGRIPRKNSRDPERALVEGSLYGYSA